MQLICAQSSKLADDDLGGLNCEVTGTTAPDRQTRVLGQKPASGQVLIEAASTIGSGDAFAGAGAAVLASGGQLVDAARTGCAVAAALIERGHNLVDDETVRRARALLSGR
jgi:sugar/nucleoside kinase (ribokinase family)